jgi:uncharacterized membrane protein
LSGFFLVLTTMLASAVEFVETLTIVLAVGLTRGWRSALLGVALALLALTAITVIFGFTLAEHVNTVALHLVIGVLLLIFGLQWLRKAVLRYAGLKALHDEEAIFATEVKELSAAEKRGGAIDWFGFMVAFKGTFLEGLEVVFIVISFGLRAQNVALAAAGAAASAVIVLVAGLFLHKPLSRVPENLMKFCVGLALVTFGTYWAGEGVGIHWRLGDGMILVILAVYMLFCGGLIQTLRRRSVPVLKEEAA